MKTRFLTQIRKTSFFNKDKIAVLAFQIYVCEVTEAGNPVSGWKEWRNNGQVVHFPSRKHAEAVRSKLRFLVETGRVTMQKQTIGMPPIVANDFERV